MIAKERHEKIISLLHQEGTIRIDDLCELLSVTSETVRRDLAALEEANLLKKVHGGATLPSLPLLNESSFYERHKHNLDKKLVIAKLASSFIRERDTIMLDASSSAYCLAETILNFDDVVIISNSLKILERLSYGTTKVVGIGGELDRSVSAFIGMQTLADLENYYATHSFISCHGLDMNLGMMDISSAEVVIKEKMLSHATVKYLLIDSSKFHQKGAMKIRGLDTINYFITDKKPSDEWLEFFETLSGSVVYPEINRSNL